MFPNSSVPYAALRWQYRVLPSPIAGQSHSPAEDLRPRCIQRPAGTMFPSGSWRGEVVAYLYQPLSYGRAGMMKSVRLQLLVTLGVVATVVGVFAVRGLPPTSSLWEAVRTDDLKGVRRCLAWVPSSVHARDERGFGPHLPPLTMENGEVMKPTHGPYWWRLRTPLHFARDPRIVEAMIRAGADVNARTEDGATPLHAAVSRGNVEAAEVLLLAEADVNARDNNGSTPLIDACTGAYLEARITLWRRPPHEIETALSRYRRLVALLLEHGADVNAMSSTGQTPLGSARLSQDRELIDSLNALAKHEEHRRRLAEAQEGSTVVVTPIRGNDMLRGQAFFRTFNKSELSAMAAEATLVVDAKAVGLYVADDGNRSRPWVIKFEVARVFKGTTGGEEFLRLRVKSPVLSLGMPRANILGRSFLLPLISAGSGQTLDYSLVQNVGLLMNRTAAQQLVRMLQDKDAPTGQQ